MNFMFPYRLISKDSKIVLYGAGNVGKDFYLQMLYSKYCEILAWTDRSFDRYKLEKPFDYTRNIKNYDMDYVVLAVEDHKIAESIRDNLIKQGIPEKLIIWSRSHYCMGHDRFPMNKELYLRNLDFYMNITDKYLEANSIYGWGKFYESYTELGLKGCRDTEERLSLYHIRDFLDKNSVVLDIGCNCGFLDMQAAGYVKSITGIDINPRLIEIANDVKKFAGIQNVCFQCADFWKNIPKETYHAVFSFAVHTNIMESGASMEEFADRIYRLILENGYLFFESHNLRNDAERYENLCDLFIKKGMKLCMRQNYFSDFERDITVFQKLNAAADITSL